MTKPTDPPTLVIFRTWRDVSRAVVALFPELPFNNQGLCTSYMHVGQHGGAAYAGVIEQTRPATRAEYASLLRELRAIGYDNLIIRRRWQRDRG